MKVFCISQARLGSTRLPKKVLKTIKDKTLLHYQVERVKQAKLVDQYIIATTNKTIDNAIGHFCHQHQIKFFCGDENNVLSRFYHTALAFNATENDLIIRLTSDCPLVAPELIDQLIEQHIANKNIAISNIDIQSYPRGFDAEIFSMAALTQAFYQASTAFQQEHVTPYFYQHPQQYPCQSISYSEADNDSALLTSSTPAELRLCVDEPADFELVKQLITQFPKNIIQASAHEIINFLTNTPQISQINQHVQQKNYE